MYLQLHEYPPYSDKQSDIFETNINKIFICNNGYTNHIEKNVLITWVQKKSWKISLSGFLQELDINPSPRTIVCNNCKIINVSGDILNAGGNVEDEDDYGFTGYFSKNSLLF